MGRDEIKVTDVKLIGAGALTTPDTEVVQFQRWQTYISLIRQASLGVAALVALVLGYVLLRRLRPALPAAPVSPPVLAERTQRVETFGTLAQRDPERVARLLSAWLEESEPPARRAAA
jgi:hypothetical protein